jgi:hypothetical protein
MLNNLCKTKRYKNITGDPVVVESFNGVLPGAVHLRIVSGERRGVTYFEEAPDSLVEIVSNKQINK